MLFSVRLVYALVSVLILLAYCSVSTWHQGPAKSWVKIFWGSSSLSGTMLVLAPPGAVPAVGGYLYPSVLRSPGATPQKSRAAHGPRHPAVIIPLRLCLLDVCLLLGVSWVFVWLRVWVSWSSGLKCCLVWCPSRPAPCLLDVCVPSLCCWVRSPTTFLFLSFSFSGAGETQTPFGVWVSPCVLFFLDADYVFDPYALLSLYI